MSIANTVIESEKFKTLYKNGSISAKNATKFWNTFNIDPNGMIKDGQFSQLRDRLFQLLNACKQIDIETFKKIHKGHPYYYIGITSYYLHDYRTAIYFFDAAVQEDLDAGAEPKTNPKPSTHFLMLEGEAERQAGKKVTEYAQTKVQRALNYYNNDVTEKVKTTTLTIENIREKFLYYALINKTQTGLRTLIASFIIFCVEWDYRNEHFDFEIAEKTSSQPFFLHIFEGCLLFESLLRNKPDPKPNGHSLERLFRDQDIKTKFNIDLEDIKKRLNRPDQGGEYSIEDLYYYISQYNNTIERTIHITYVARNVLGHNLGWDKNIKQDEYQKLCFIVLSSYLYAIDCL